MAHHHQSRGGEDFAEVEDDTLPVKRETSSEADPAFQNLSPHTTTTAPELQDTTEAPINSTIQFEDIRKEGTGRIRIPTKPRTRSRDGCVNCKRRKVKCNESRPRCALCQRLGLECAYSVDATSGASKLATDMEVLFPANLEMEHKEYLRAFSDITTRISRAERDTTTAQHSGSDWHLGNFYSTLPVDYRSWGPVPLLGDDEKSRNINAIPQKPTFLNYHSLGGVKKETAESTETNDHLTKRVEPFSNPKSFKLTRARVTERMRLIKMRHPTLGRSSNIKRNDDPAFTLAPDATIDKAKTGISGSMHPTSARSNNAYSLTETNTFDKSPAQSESALFSTILADRMYRDLRVGAMAADLMPLSQDSERLIWLLQSFASAVAPPGCDSDTVCKQIEYDTFQNTELISRRLVHLIEIETSDHPKGGFSQLTLSWANEDTKLLSIDNRTVGTDIGDNMAKWPKLQIDSKSSSEDQEEPIVDSMSSLAIDNYNLSLDSSEAYDWLIKSIKRDLRTQTVYARHRNTISRIMCYESPRETDRYEYKPKSHAAEAVFRVEWDVLGFFASQDYSGTPSEALPRAVVVVGQPDFAQATTCGEYMREMWPITGEQTLECLQQFLMQVDSCSGYVHTSDLPFGQLTVRISYPHIIVSAKGTRLLLVEIGEQLSWLCASFQPSRNTTDLAISRAVMMKSRSVRSAKDSHLSIPVTYFRINHYVIKAPDRYGQDDNGSCWHTMFREPVIVGGFPIRRRGDSAKGLEISLGLMADLVNARQINVFRSVPMLKGFSDLLYTAHRTDDITVWHHLCNEDGSHISFMEGITCNSLTATMSEIETSRHVVGWCHEVNLHVGSADANLNVQFSDLPEADHLSPFEDASLQRGRLVQGGSHLLGSKDKHPRLSRGDYRTRLLWLLSRKLMLWDEDDSRGWLANGMSILLHLLRAHIHHHSTGIRSTMFDLRNTQLKHDSTASDVSAVVQVLTAKENLDLLISSAETTTFRDRIEEYYNILDQLIDHQDDVDRHCRRSNISRPRSRLDGWDFSEIASGNDFVEARIATLEPRGKCWVDLLRSLRVAILFGRNFGELIQPAQSCASCTLASQVPKDQYYLAAQLEDMKYSRQRVKHNGISVSIPTLGGKHVWHTPDGVPELCLCRSDRVTPIQVVLPKGTSSKFLASETTLQPSPRMGLIFGHNPRFGWQYDDDNGIPTRLDGDQVPTTTDFGITPQDSGYESSPPIEFSRVASSVPEIGIICALPKELKAVRSLFECRYYDQNARDACDPNVYAFGHLSGFNVVAACLPFGQYGTTSAATVATNLNRSFPNLKLCMLVGIAAGIPDRKDVRLGDVVVGISSSSGPAIVHHNAGHLLPDGFRRTKQPLRDPPKWIAHLISDLASDPDDTGLVLDRYLERIGARDKAYKDPGPEFDVLFSNEPPDSLRPSCDGEEIYPWVIVSRDPRDTRHPVVHYGSIATGDQLVRDSRARKQIGQDTGALCIEMEAAGVTNELECLVIRGICDYADCHKNDRWQEYAAAAAASYAAYLLTKVPKSETQHNESRSQKRPAESSENRKGKNRRVDPI